MKRFHILLPLAAAALAAPPAAAAQDDCPCRRPGMIGVVFDTDDTGARVVEVRRGSAADRAGMREGDVVVAVDGAPAADRVPGLPMRLQAGDTVRLAVSRDGARREVVVVATPREGALAMGAPFIHTVDGSRALIVRGDSLERPLRALTVRMDSLHGRLLRLDSAGFRVRIDSLVRVLGDSSGVRVDRLPRLRTELRQREVEVLGREREAFSREDGARALQTRTFFLEMGRRAAAGAELAPMNEGLARYFGGQRTGALVTQVGPGTPAERAGLQAGDVIVGAAGEDVATPDDLRRHLSARGGSVPLQVIREGRRRELTLAWEGAREERVIIRGRAP